MLLVIDIYSFEDGQQKTQKIKNDKKTKLKFKKSPRTKSVLLSLLHQIKQVSQKSVDK